MLRERQQATIAGFLWLLAPTLGDLDRQHDQADNPRGGLQRLHVDLEPTRPRRRCDFDRVFMELTALQDARVNARMQCRGRNQLRCRNAQQPAGQRCVRAHGDRVGVGDLQVLVQDQLPERQVAYGHPSRRRGCRRGKREHDQALPGRHGQWPDIRKDGKLALGTPPFKNMRCG
jgi:hypothetical protein